MGRIELFRTISLKDKCVEVVMKVGGRYVGGSRYGGGWEMGGE